MNPTNSSFFKRSISAGNITHTILTVLLVLIPVFFIPSLFLTATIAKSVFISVGTLLALVSFGVTVIRRGTVSFPKNPVVFGSIVLLVAYFISSIVSTSTTASFLGYGFETTTFLALLLACMLLHLVSVSFNDFKKLFVEHIAFLSVAGLLTVFYTVLMLAGGGSLSNSSFLNFIVTAVGKTNELALFFGAAALLSLVALDTLRLNKLYRVVLYTIVVLSFVVVAIINFLTAWYLLSFMLLIFFVYQITFLNAQHRLSVVSSVSSGVQSEGVVGQDTVSETRLQSSRKKIPIRTAVFLGVTLLFIVPSFFGINVGQGLSTKFSFNSLEVRPSWESSIDIFKSAISKAPLAGPGPNRFSTQWQLFRPDVNMTDFWSLDFDFGIGFIPTVFVETGVVGIVGWLVFLLSILYVGVKAVFVRTADQTTRYLVVSSFLVTIFLWLSNIFYSPSSGLFALSFFFSGLMLAAAVLVGVGERKTLTLIPGKKSTFVVIAISVCVLLVAAGVGYRLFTFAAASVYYQKANTAMRTEGNIEKAENFLFKAVDMAPNDVYYRMVADISIARIANLLNASAGKSEVTEAEKNEFQNALQNAAEAAQRAVAFDPLNFQNKAAAGQVYETIIPVQIEGAYEMAKKLYEEAVALSPRNPSLFLALARVEVAQGNMAKGQEYIQKALELKWNYPDAIFLQSQIDIAKGNVPAAIKAVQQIAALTPNDPLVYFRLGLLQYDVKNFTQAIAAFEKSISLVPVYANAKYFLGLSYAKAGRTADAIRVFTELKSANPEVTELNSILANLKAGGDPFAGDAENADPEKRKELPVKESRSSENP